MLPSGGPEVDDDGLDRNLEKGCLKGLSHGIDLRNFEKKFLRTRQN
jgi:hypothetical protein